MKGPAIHTAIASLASSENGDSFWSKRAIGSVIDYLDANLTPKGKAEVRHTQLETLWKRGTFEPQLKGDCKGHKVFPHTWVDKNSKGEAKSRFTVADSRKHMSKEELLDEMSTTSAPTPHEESHTAIKVYALKKDVITLPFDIVCAFTIDPGDKDGNTMYVQSCAEHEPFISDWCKQHKPKWQISTRIIFT